MNDPQAMNDPETMNGPQTTRLVKTALRCYPARWRRRHAAEAAELAALLIRDGTPAASIASSYLAGATREWLTPRPGRRMSAVACALLTAACSAGLLATTVPARAASTIPPPAHCQPTPPAPVPDSAAAPSRHQLIIREAWHARSC
jgi:hypothetical protein